MLIKSLNGTHKTAMLQDKLKILPQCRILVPFWIFMIQHYQNANPDSTMS